MSAAKDQSQASGVAIRSVDSYRPEIDGLRAFAVVAVIINHFNKSLLPSGYLGVDIFFVISGLVITSSLSRRKSKNFQDFLGSFYERRIRRLVPGLVFFVLIASLSICLVSPSPNSSLLTGVFSLFGLSNIHLFTQAADYFGQALEMNIFAHTWSLGVEEQFYILFPFLIWFSGFGRQSNKGARNFFVIVGALTLVSLIGFIYLYQFNQPAAYFLMPTRFWEMAAGCLLFLGLQKKPKILACMQSVPPLLILLAMVVVMFLPTTYGVPATILMVVFTALLISSLRKGTMTYQILAHNKIVFLGLMSYSLYLWHWGVLAVSRWTVGVQPWTVPVQIVLIMVFGTCSYLWIETPFRRRAHSHINKRRTIILNTLGLVLSAVGIGIISLPFVNRVMFWKASAYFNSSEQFYKTHWIGWNDCDNVELLIDSERKGACKIYKYKDKRPSILVVGDSHAGHLATGLKDVSAELKSTIAIVYQPACYPAPRLEEDCDNILEAIEWALSRKDVALVILAGYHNIKFQKRLKNYRKGEDVSAVDEGALSNLVAKLQEIATSLVSSGKDVLLVIDSHELRRNPADVALRSYWTARDNSLDMPRLEVESRNKRFYETIESLTASLDGFHLLRLNEIFCDHVTCSAASEDMQLYFQSEDHLTPFAAQVIAPTLIRKIESFQ